MSLSSALGPEAELLRDARSPRRRVRLDGPVLRADELERVLAAIGDNGFRVLDATWDVAGGPEGLAPAVAALVAGACEDVRRGARILVLSDRGIGEGRAAVPSLLATSAVHHALIREGAAPVGVADRGLRRAARGPPPRVPGRLRRRRGAPVAAARLGRGRRRAGGRAAQGAAEGDVQDGHLDRLELPRRAGVRGDRALGRARRGALHGHHARGWAAIGLQGLGREALERHAARLPRARASLRRRVPLAARDGAPRVGPGRGRGPAGRDPRRERVGEVQRDVRRGGARPDDPRAARLRGRPAGGAAARGRAGGGDRVAVRHRRDVARLDLPRGARDARDRHEPDRRALEHRRGRRGPAPLRARSERRLQALGDQADRLRRASA